MMVRINPQPNPDGSLHIAPISHDGQHITNPEMLTLTNKPSQYSVPVRVNGVWYWVYPDIVDDYDPSKDYTDELGHLIARDKFGDESAISAEKMEDEKHRLHDIIHDALSESCLPPDTLGHTVGYAIQTIFSDFDNLGLTAFVENLNHGVEGMAEQRGGG